MSFEGHAIRLLKYHYFTIVCPLCLADHRMHRYRAPCLSPNHYAILVHPVDPVCLAYHYVIVEQPEPLADQYEVARQPVRPADDPLFAKNSGC